MRRALLLLVPAALVAQAPKQDPWQAFQQRLKRNQPATLVILESASAPWEATLKPLLTQEPLVGLSLPMRALQPGQTAGKAVLERLGWSLTVPRWALMDAKGQAVAGGMTLPTAEVLAQAYRDAGLKTRSEQLQAFLAKHPGHDEGRILLIQELRTQAERRTCALLGLAMPKPGSSMSQVAIQGMVMGEAPPPPPTLPEKDLPSDQDDRIWGLYARELGLLFEGGSWMSRMIPELPGHVKSLGMQFGGQELISDYARVSPAARQACERILPQLERALEHRPSSTYLWSLWLAASRPTGKGDMGSLMARLTPLPGVTAKDWPPLLIRTAYYQDCRRREDWKAMQEMAEAQIDSLRTMAEVMKGLSNETMSKETKDASTRTLYDEASWSSAGEPLLESYLRQQKGAEADRLVREWVERGSRGVVVKARTLARTCGHKDLDERWKELEKAP